MKTIPISALRSNILHSGFLFLDESYILTTPETPITDSLLKRLKTWQIHEVSGEDGSSDTVQTLDDNRVYDERPPDDSEDGVSKEETQKFYTGLLEFTHKLYDTFLKRSVIGIEPLIDQVKALIAMYKKNRRFLLRLNDLDRSGFSYILCHSVNVAILAVALGDALKLPSHKMIELGMAGILHEIGMFKLPDSFQNANRPLTEAERRALTAHPILGYRILKELGFNPNVTLAVLEHHEKEDGTGYPQGLTGEKVAMSAKILSIASAYDAQISSRPYRVARSGHASLMDLLKDIRRTYDDQILKRLVFVLSLYPLGSIVELKSGAYAIVDDTDSSDPKHPHLLVLTDERKVPLVDYPSVKVAERPDVDIHRVLTGDEVQRLRADKVISA